MDTGREELKRIKEVLKGNPKGLSLSDISRLVNMNRHSIAKYMEMLTISGQVEMRSFGPSKVYYLSQRVPISAMLSFSSDMICTLDRDMKIIQVNEAFLEFFGYDRGDILGQNIQEIDHAFPVNSGMIRLIGESLNGKAHQHNIRIQKDSGIRYIRMKLIPTAFDDGTTGVVFIGEDITVEKQAEQALKASKVALEKKVQMTTAELAKSNSLIRAVLDTLPIGVIVVDAVTARISYVSPHITRLYGMDLEGRVMDASLEGLTIQWPDGRPVDDDETPMIRALRNGETIDMAEHTLRLKDNREVYVLINSAPAYGPDGQVTAAVSTITDITERKRAEEKLRESEVRFRSLIHNSSDIIRILDKEGRIVYDSPSSGKILGYPPGHMIGRSPLEFIHPDDRKRVEEELNEVYARTNPGTPTEFRLLKADGTFIEVESVGMNMIGVPGVDGIVVNTRPIAERKRAEEAIRESRERFKAIFDRAATGIAISDPGGYMIDSNAAFQEMTGYSKEELRQRRFYDITHPEDVDSNRELHMQLAEGRINKYQIEKRYIRKDGSILWARMTASAIRDREGGFMYNIAIVEDITEQKQIQKSFDKT